MNTLEQLTKMNSVPLDMTLDGLAALRRQERSDVVSLADTQRKHQYELNADPLRLQQMSLNNQVSLQDLATKTRDNREKDFTSGARMLADYKGLLAKSSEADLSLAETKAREMAMSDDPAIASKGRALVQATKEFLLQKQKDDADIAKANTQGEWQRKIMQMQIDAGRFDKVGKQVLSLSQQLQKENDPIKKDALLRQAVEYFGNKQSPEYSPELAQLYTALHQANYPAYESAVRIRGIAAQGKIDVPGMAQLPGVPGAQPAPPVSVVRQPTAPQQPTQDPFAGFSIK